MDVVYPLGGQRGPHRQQEIRFAIRGLLQHSTEPVGRIFIVGEKPEFFDYSSDRIVHIPNAPDVKAKELRIWHNVLAAAKDDRVSDEFFFSNDDYFFCQDFSVSDFPFYSNGDMATKSYAGQAENDIARAYDRKAKRTLDALRRWGLPTEFYDIHVPNRVRKESFVRCYEAFKDDLYIKHDSPNGSLCINTVYANFAGEKPTFRHDVKIQHSDIARMRETYREHLVFSTFDTARCDEMLAFLEKIYPVPAPFEL